MHKKPFFNSFWKETLVRCLPVGQSNSDKHQHRKLFFKHNEQLLWQTSVNLCMASMIKNNCVQLPIQSHEWVECESQIAHDQTRAVQSRSCNFELGSRQPPARENIPSTGDKLTKQRCFLIHAFSLVLHAADARAPHRDFSKNNAAPFHVVSMLPQTETMCIHPSQGQLTANNVFNNDNKNVKSSKLVQLPTQRKSWSGAPLMTSCHWLEDKKQH